MLFFEFSLCSFFYPLVLFILPSCAFLIAVEELFYEGITYYVSTCKCSYYDATLICDTKHATLLKIDNKNDNVLHVLLNNHRKYENTVAILPYGNLPQFTSW